MSTSRISFRAPKLLLEIMSRRGKLRGRNRASEIRSLLETGLSYANGADVEVLLHEEDWVITGTVISLDLREIIQVRADQFHRSLGREIVCLVSYAMQEIERRDLEIINSMLERQARSAPSR